MWLQGPPEAQACRSTDPFLCAQFYKGDGYKFAPFDFKTLKAQEEAGQA